MKKIKFLVICLVSLHLYALVSLTFTAWPEMLLWPYLLIKGWLPYLDISIAHTPILITSLSIFYKIFGVGISQLKIFTWATILTSDILVFAIAKKVWNQKVALVSLGVYIFWQLVFDGNGLWFDLALVPLSLAIFYFIHIKKYVFAGIFWVFLFFTKQTGVWFLLPIVLSIIKDRTNLVVSIRQFVIGAVCTFTALIFAVWCLGILPYFYKWAINFGIFYLPKAQGQIQLPELKMFFRSILPFSIFTPFLFTKKGWKSHLLVWAIAGGLGAYPRFEYFHFQPAIPFLAFASGNILSNFYYCKTIKIFLILYFVGSVYLFTNFLLRNWDKETRFYGNDVRDVSEYVKKNTKVGDKIFILNWWDNVYALTETEPATGPWVPQLSWYQNINDIQIDEVNDLKETRPKLILMQDYSENGLSSYKPEKVLEYVLLNYKIKEKIDSINILVPK